MKSNKEEGVLALGDYRIMFNWERWETLPPGRRDLALLLHEAHVLKDVDPTMRPEWIAWWTQAEYPWDGLFSSKEIRRLNQSLRAVAEAGLGINLHRRKASYAPLKDPGILERVVGLEWEEGMRDVLTRLAKRPATERSHRLSSAFLHAVELGKEKSLRWLVEWAAAHEVLFSPEVDGEALGRAWMLWSDKGQHQASDPVYATSLKSIRIPEGSINEEIAWNLWIEKASLKKTHDAVAAWCATHPGSWERLHQKAMQPGHGPRHAWMVACHRARMFGQQDPLWREAIGSASAAQWMQLPWRRNGASALTAWLASSMGHDKKSAGYRPGQDKVSAHLRALGALEPGSPAERAKGGPSLIECVAAYEISPEWFLEQPNWALPNPTTGRTPLFDESHWHYAKDFARCGLSWLEVDFAGNNAFACFLQENRGKPHKKAAQEMIELLQCGDLPVVGQSQGHTIAASVAGLGHTEMFAVFTRLRLAHAEPVSPLETAQVVKEGVDPAQHWQWALKRANCWTQQHEFAWWRGVMCSYHRKDFGAGAIEDAEDPAWAWLMDKTDDDRIAEALAACHEWSFAPINANHAGWDRPQWGERWLRLVDDCSGVEQTNSLRPSDPAPQWWAARISQLNGLAAAQATWLSDGEKLLDKLLYLGMPLDATVCQALCAAPLVMQMGEGNPMLASALQAHALDASTVCVQAPRRSLRL